MEQISRRNLLRMGAVGIPAIALAACANQNTVETVSQTVLTDIGLIANGLTAALPLLMAVPGIPADAVAKAQTAVHFVIQSANQLKLGMTVASILPTIQQIGANLSYVIDVVTPFLGLIPPPGGTIIMALQVLFPVIETAVGLLKPTTPRLAMSAMSVDQARAVLAAAH